MYRLNEEIYSFETQICNDDTFVISLINLKDEVIKESNRVLVKKVFE